MGKQPTGSTVRPRYPDRHTVLSTFRRHRRGPLCGCIVWDPNDPPFAQVEADPYWSGHLRPYRNRWVIYSYSMFGYVRRQAYIRRWGDRLFQQSLDRLLSHCLPRTQGEP